MGFNDEELRRKAGKQRPDEIVDDLTTEQSDELRRVFEEGSPAEIASYVTVNEADIRETLSRHSGIYAYVAVQYREAKVEVARAKREVDRVRASVFNYIQEQDPGLAIGKTERRVETNERVEEAEAALRKAELREGRLRAASEALEHRKDMLQNIAAILRREMETYSG